MTSHNTAPLHRAAAAFLAICLLLSVCVTTVFAYPDAVTAAVFEGAYASGGELTADAVYASSTLIEKGYDHSPANIWDHDTKTDWCEGAFSTGAGEWIELSYGSDVPVDTIIVYPGFWKSEQLFKENCRPEWMTVSFSDGSSVPVYFTDTMVPFSIELSRTVNTRYIRFTVDSVYSGSKYRDLCLSEILVFSNNSKYMNGADPFVSVSGCKFPSSINRGSSIDLTGIVSTAAGLLTEVTCSVVNSYGVIVATGTEYPASFSFDLHTSQINSDIRFGLLSPGSYTFRISARAVNGYRSSSGVAAVYPFTVGVSSSGSSSASGGSLPAPTDYVYNSTTPFYGIWCEATHYYSGAVDCAKAWADLGYHPRILVTTDWSNLNKEPWYVITPEVFYSKSEADAWLPSIKQIYEAAWVKYTGERVYG